ncbi:MAG: transposase [Desulfatitalea sp.]|nr:transposase [Desulfatitalea sp.]
MKCIPQKGSRRLRKGRRSIEGHYYLLTTTTHERRRLLMDGRIAKVVLESLEWLHSKELIFLLSAVAMPDHVHLVCRLLQEDLGRTMQRFKTYTAAQANAILERNGPFWQRHFHDHAIRSDENLHDIVLYCLHNPVRWGLVDHFHQYPHWRCCWDV